MIRRRLQPVLVLLSLASALLPAIAETTAGAQPAGAAKAPINAAAFDEVNVLDTVKWGMTEQQVKDVYRSRVQPFAGRYDHPTQTAKLELTSTAKAPATLLFLFDDKTHQLAQIVVRPSKSAKQEDWFNGMTHLVAAPLGPPITQKDSWATNRFVYSGKRGNAIVEKTYMGPGSVAFVCYTPPAELKVAPMTPAKNSDNLKSNLQAAQMAVATNDVAGIENLVFPIISTTHGAPGSYVDDDPTYEARLIEILRSLATLYYQKGSYEGAVTYFGLITELEKNNSMNKGALLGEYEYIATLAECRGYYDSAAHWLNLALKEKEAAVGKNSKTLEPLLKKLVVALARSNQSKEAAAMQARLATLK